MWINNNLKSISERNFLVLLLTYIIGPAQANIFKVANDGALLFYRAIIKTIDTSDTVLLAHIELEKKGQKLTAIAFKKIITKIASLTFPLLGIVALIGIHGVENYHSSFVFQAFIIMTCGYLVETLCMPYERILEVKRRYGYLTLAYIPYIVMLLFLFTNSVIPSIGLLITLGLIHTVRLVSLMIMVFFARSLYHVPFPFIFVLKITSISLIGLSVGYFILTYMVPHDYERVIFYLFPSIR